MDDQYETGMAIRRKVLGNAHVESAENRKTEFDEPFQNMITRTAWGSVWAGKAFSLRERSIVTLALLASQGLDEEFAMHLRATANTGASPEDVREALMHVAIYSGVPRANHAIKIAKTIYEEMGIET